MFRSESFSENLVVVLNYSNERHPRLLATFYVLPRTPFIYHKAFTLRSHDAAYHTCSDVPINLFESTLHRRMPEYGYSFFMIDTGG